MPRVTGEHRALSVIIGLYLAAFPHPPSTKNFFDTETREILTFARTGVAGIDALPRFKFRESASRVLESLA